MRRPALPLVGLLIFLVGGGILVFFVAKGERSDPSSSHPSAPKTEPEIRLDDPQEELLYALERAFDDYRVGVTQMDENRILAIFSDDFVGDTLFAALLGNPTLDLPHVNVRSLDRLPKSRKDLPEAIRRFYREIDTVTLYVTKVADARPQGEDLLLTVKTSLQATKGKGWVHIKEKFHVRMRDHRIVAQERVSGTRAESDRRSFEDVTETLGLTIPPDIECHGCSYRTPTVHLGGVGLADYNDDGALDVFTVGPQRCYLFANRGDRFEDVTEKSGVSGGGSGVLWVDVDNDRRSDLLITGLCAPDRPCSGCAIRLFRNRGDGTFEDVTEKAGLRFKGNAYSACAADIDGDGDLDLYVGFYGGPKTDPDGGVAYGLDAESFLTARNGEPNRLFRNNGDGTFTEIAGQAGVADTGWTLACGFLDIDRDRKPDLYVVNDFGANALYRNRGDGTFEDVSRNAGDSGFGMGLTRGDYDNDGDVDLYVSNMSSTAGNRILDQSQKELPPELYQRMRKAAAGNTLLRNRGDGTFENVSEASGTGGAGWAWGCVFSDYDNDGRPDLYVANGFVSGRLRKDL